MTQYIKDKKIYILKYLLFSYLACVNYFSCHSEKSNSKDILRNSNSQCEEIYSVLPRRSLW